MGAKRKLELTQDQFDTLLNAVSDAIDKCTWEIEYGEDDPSPWLDARAEYERLETKLRGPKRKKA